MESTPEAIEGLWQQMIDGGSAFLPDLLEEEWQQFAVASPEIQQQNYKDLVKAAFTPTRARAWAMVNNPDVMMFESDETAQA